MKNFCAAHCRSISPIKTRRTRNKERATTIFHTEMKWIEIIDYMILIFIRKKERKKVERTEPAEEIQK